MKYTLYLLLLLPCVYNYSLAKETRNTTLANKRQHIEKRTIEKIIIKGNENTKDSVIEDCLHVKEGDPFSAFDYDRAMQNLYRTRLFESVELNIVADKKKKVEIHVAVKEKISLIPIPMIMYSGEDYTFGLLLMESNFMGYNNKLMLGGVYSNKGWNSIIMFEEPGENKNSLVYNVIYQVGRNETENTDFKDTHVYQRYKSLDNDFSINIGYKFLYQNRFYIQNSIKTARIDDNYSKNIMQPESSTYYLTGVRYIFENLQFTQNFKTGFETNLEYNHGFNLDEEDENTHNDLNNTIDQVKITASYQTNPWFNHLLSFKISAGAGDLPETMEERIGGNECFKSLPNGNISADYYTGTTIGYETPFYSSQRFIFTNIFYYEAGWYKRIDVDDNYYNGIGCGLRMYLKKLAIPAIGIDGTYNLNTKNYEISAVIGFKQ